MDIHIIKLNSSTLAYKNSSDIDYHIVRFGGIPNVIGKVITILNQMGDQLISADGSIEARMLQKVIEIASSGEPFVMTIPQFFESVEKMRQEGILNDDVTYQNLTDMQSRITEGPIIIPERSEGYENPEDTFKQQDIPDKETLTQYSKTAI